MIIIMIIIMMIIIMITMAPMRLKIMIIIMIVIMTINTNIIITTSCTNVRRFDSGSSLKKKIKMFCFCLFLE